jgi:hypothetical protein
MYEVIKQRLRTLPDDAIVLTIVPADQYQDINFFLLDHWMKKSNNYGTYLSLNKPYNYLKKCLEAKGIDEKRLFFIDCVTRKETTANNCIFLHTQQSLMNISISISRVFKQSKPDFLILDSLNTLVLYNGSGPALKFAHFLVTRLREHKVQGILLVVAEEKNSNVVNELSQLCDKVIDLSKSTTFI